MTPKDALARAPRIEQDILTLARAGGIASEIARSKVGGVAAALARTLPEMFSYAELERGIGDILSQAPSVREPASGSPEERKAQETERAANPTRDDYARMSVSERLEAINAAEHREREAQAAKDAKFKSDEYTPDQLRAMTPARRLEATNELARFGAQEPEPKAPSPEQLRKMDAARRLDAVNAQIEASRKSASALAKRLKTAKDQTS
jgi:hypothetical protein